LLIASHDTGRKKRSVVVGPASSPSASFSILNPAAQSHTGPPPPHLASMLVRTNFSMNLNLLRPYRFPIDTMADAFLSTVHRTASGLRFWLKLIRTSIYATRRLSHSKH